MVDEAHLSQQLMHTAIEVAALVARRADAIRPVPPLQVVSATATQAIAGSETEGVREADLQVDRALEVRLRTFKELRIVRESVKASPAKRAAFIAEQAVALSQAVAEQQKPTVLVIVNRRATAAAVTDLLVKEVGWEAVVCWAGRMRPMDVDALREERPGLLSIDGNPQTKFLVATQTAEVGVDLDCAALVTELAPGTSLTQRFGRVDRLGERRAAQIAVVVPGALVADQPPYRAGDLSAALDWLEEIGNGGDVSPWRLRETPPPQESLRRRALSDVWPSDAELLARTTGDLFEEPDLAFWLRDDLEDDESPVGVVIRRLPFADEGALALLRQVPLVAAEAFPASIGTARRVIARALGAARSLDLGHEPRAFRFREDDFALIDGNEDQLRPGDVVIVDQDVPVTWHNMLMPDLPGAAARPAPRVYSGSDDVRVFWPGDRLAGFDPCVVFAGPIEAAQEFYDQLLSDGRVKEPRQVRTVPDLVDDEGNLPWVVLVPPEVVREDEELRQEWSASGPVLLAVHQDAVAARAVEYAERLGLPPTLVDALRDAGLHHDDGKQEVEFQRMLRDRSDQQQITAVNGVLAKSIGRSSQRVKRLAATRQGWRHEQLSVAFTQLALGMDEHGFLAARLVGTSHGHGRPFFPHGPDSLLQSEGIAQPVRDAAQALYQAGAGWSDLLSQTDGRFGVWGIAYLEAVLRAADGTVSGEGS